MQRLQIKHSDEIRIIFISKLLNKNKLQKQGKTHTAKDSLLLEHCNTWDLLLIKMQKAITSPQEQILWTEMNLGSF